mmetsp:Transcript_5357/g.10250  ORF Transcript_5357/g.10250 Transcript_5357/m.10250 type:complete len:455 (-) Transcript_5357:56-1420(-)|eukprot:CAMPEP_0178693906 /NCGR_PEP_ID=MMETSP0699-20121125/7958_1 /TAXON_ID=265572 /ORGANISM="Extubocellulus spinifer, Strain CCMP396" /LENGTH=454 /DNA_ID=CAMNT_0020339341 /DNA_START=57 /DNA_END=1421 /DNA_ORIENTATION=+
MSNDSSPALNLSVTPRRDRAPPSAADLSELNDVLQSAKPLTGRRVMVPVTTQAFFEGRLQPATRAEAASCTGTTSNVGTDARPRPNEEMVLANLGDGYLAEMSREEAADFIKRRADAAAGPTPAISASGKKKSALKQTRQGERVQTAKKQQQSKTNAHSALSFIEIREEFDSEGREVKAEAVNVAKEMKALKDALRSQRDSGSEGSNGGEEAKAIRELIENMDIHANEDETVQGIDDDEVEALESQQRQQAEKPVSDEKYSSLSARLDELARLEEEAERNKNEGKGSRQRLQGKAWGKGFLSNSEKGTGSKQAKKSKKSSKKGGWNKGFLNAESKEENTSPEKAEPIDASTEEPDREKTVAFGENEVKEIPRIGQNSIKAAQKPRSATRFDTASHAQERAAPIANDLFAGVVTERQAETSGGVDIARPKQEQQQQPRKKLSRFAQQRLEQRGEL